MDEISVVLEARKFVNKVDPRSVPVPIQAYVHHIGAVVHRQTELELDEPGWSFNNSGKHYICVNSKDSSERQNFTICHEIAHIVLELPSDHNATPSWSYASKSKNEIFCDMFASELLLPYKLFRPQVDKASICLAAVDDLARRFAASTMATGSRFAVCSHVPCAFVLSEKGIVRYASRSTTLRDSNAWVSPRIPLPNGSVAKRKRAEIICDSPEEVEADIWFSNWDRGGVLLEDSRHLSRWDQTVSLLWFKEEEVPPIETDRNEREEQEFGLAELDGILTWPDKRRRN